MSLSVSIIDRVYHIICWPNDFADALGVAVQIMVAVVSLAVSIIGIAISLQNEEFFGVKLTKLYALRKGKHYSILKIIIISILLCVSNLLFYMFQLNIAVIGTLIVSLMFILKVVKDEVPIMSKKENALLRILRDNIIYCYLNKKEASSDLKEAVKYLLYNKNFREIFEHFSDDSDEEFNEYLLLKLMEIQEDLAFEIGSKYTEHEQKTICSSLLDNVLDIVQGKVKLSDDFYAKVIDNKFMLLRVMFCMHRLPSTKEQFSESIQRLFQMLLYTGPESERKTELISDVIIVTVAGTIRECDFSVISIIRHQLADHRYGLTRKSPVLDLFAVISMHIYYLCCADPDVPDNMKEKIRMFIDEGGMIEEDTKITSWSSLFRGMSEQFDVDYKRFIGLATRNEHVLQYYLFGNGPKLVVLNHTFLSKWYFTNLLNTRKAFTLDYSSVVGNDDKIQSDLLNFGKECLDENGVFVISDDMEKIINFYDNNKSPFAIFKIAEEREHRFFSFINSLRCTELRNILDRVASVDGDVLGSKINRAIREAVQTEWGFNQKLTIANPKRYFSFMLEKFPDEINFGESIIQYCVDSVFLDIRKATKRTILYGNEKFEDDIRKMLKRDLHYITAEAREIIPDYYIRDKILRDEYCQKCETMIDFQSKILGNNALVGTNGFAFNCEVEKVESRQLTEEEVNNKAKEYQRADGQFVFEGAFLPREEIIKTIKVKFVVLTVVFSHKVISSEETVFELKPYYSGPED